MIEYLAQIAKYMLNGDISFSEAMELIKPSYRLGEDNPEKDAFKLIFGDVNPYYERRIRRRLDMIQVLKLAKENGCEAYITPFESNYDYGYMIFPREITGDPIDIIMYIQNGDFWGFNFYIQYIPSNENGSGCRCNEESICEIDWNTLLEQKKEGLAYANQLKANMYVYARHWKEKCWNFNTLIQL